MQVNPTSGIRADLSAISGDQSMKSGVDYRFSLLPGINDCVAER
jgi:hypothetical protein